GLRAHQQSRRRHHPRPDRRRHLRRGDPRARLARPHRGDRLRGRPHPDRAGELSVGEEHRGERAAGQRLPQAHAGPDAGVLPGDLRALRHGQDQAGAAHDPADRPVRHRARRHPRPPRPRPHRAEPGERLTRGGAERSRAYWTLVQLDRPAGGARRRHACVDFPLGPPNTQTQPRKAKPNTITSRREAMPATPRSCLKNSAATVAAVGLSSRFASAQAETIRIGVVYDLSGPFAAGGSVACSVGAQIAIDLVNERGGVGGKYKVVPINADCQSKVDVAINEVERLLSQEKVEIVNGVYASAHAVPLAAKVEAQKKILWITTAISTAVFKDKNLQYVFRGQIHSDQYGEAFATFIAENAKARLGKEAKDIKVAIIHEDGPYGVG